MRLTPEQLSARRNGLGSTDIVQILGAAPWQNAGPMAVYIEKLGLAPAREATAEQDWGHELEPLIAKWYERERKCTLFPCGTTQSTTFPWLFCTHDFAIHGEKRGIEIKNVSRWMAKHWDDTEPDGVPHYVRIQVNIQMAVCDYREADVCAAIAGSPPMIWRVQRDDDLIAHALKAGESFWRDHVLAQVPPELDGSAAARAYLNATYPKEEDPIVLDADDGMNHLAATRIQASINEANAETSKRRCDDELLAMIAKHEAARGIVHGSAWQLTWKTGRDGVRRSRFTVKDGGR